MKIQYFFSVSIALLGIQLISGAPTEGELFLTPLIMKGELDKAKAQAEDNMKLSNIKSEKEIKSYSGFLTIDEKTNSNLFFWFFPAQENPDNAPLILWINEIPGFSSIKGIFLETGPFELGENNEITARNGSWTKTHSMLYIDSPVGTGFSFSDSESAYADNSSDDGDEIYEALKQFFTLFKEYQTRDFFLAGENYAVSIIPYTVKKIETENAKGGLQINIKGFVIGSPFIDVKQIRKGQALFDLGLIDLDQKKTMDDLIDQAIDLAKKGQIEESRKIVYSVNLGPGSLLNQYTGFTDYYSALISKPPPQLARFQKFINSKEVHSYLHVGVHKYIGENFAVAEHFANEIANDHGEVFVELLNKGYRILIFAPQFNILIPQSGITEVVNNLKWNGAAKFSKAPRKIWKVDDEVAGYVKTADNFSYAIVRNAGNYATMEKPEWVADLVEKFLYNKEF